MTPTGTVTFTIDTTTNVTRPMNADGTATYATNALTAGAHTVVATYSGDGNLVGATSNPVTQNVNNPVPTLTSISPTSAVVNAPDLTLTVTGTNFIASSIVNWNGSARAITFVSGTKLTATITNDDLSTAGTANVTVSNPAPGGGTSDSATFTIYSTNSIVALGSSCNPCSPNSTVTFTATVSQPVGGSALGRASRLVRNAVPGGSITFQDNGNNIAGCVAVGLNGAGQAVCATVLTGGTHTLTAQYSGDANFNPASGTLTQNINYLILLPIIRLDAPLPPP